MKQFIRINKRNLSPRLGRFFFCALVLPTACVATPLPKPEQAVQAPCHIQKTAKVGTSFDFELEGVGATGYQWFAEPAPGSEIAIVAQGGQAASGESNMVGAPVKQWWTIRVVKADGASINFFLYRSWEGKEASVRHCVLQIQQ